MSLSSLDSQCVPYTVHPLAQVWPPINCLIFSTFAIQLKAYRLSKLSWTHCWLINSIKLITGVYTVDYKILVLQVIELSGYSSVN